MSKKVLVILGHSSSAGFCGKLHETYVNASIAAGNEVKVLHLGEMKFDPILHHGYQKIQTLEPDLIQAQQFILWADHISFVFPVWWGGVPAILKGFLDRILLSGFAFRFKKGSAFQEKLLKGKTAHLLITMDTPPWYFKWFYRMPAIHQMKKTVLEFCGIKPTKTLTFGPMISANVQKKEKWLEQTKNLALSLH